MTPTESGSVPRPPGTGPLPLRALADLIGHPAGAAGADALLEGVTLASAEVRAGDLYAALPGARTHGARHAADAAARGAVALLTDPSGAADCAATGLPTVVVPDPRAVLGPVAARVYGDPSRRLRVVGITGTNGKTTTSYLVEAGLAAAGLATGLIGTVQTRTRGRDASGRPVETAFPSVRTTPEAPALQALLAGMAGSGVEAVVMEVSSHALVQGRVGGMRFAAAGFTNLGRDHLDFHGDLESYFRAKALLFDGRAEAEVVNADDPFGRRLAQRPGVLRVSLGEHRDAEWVAGNLAAAPDGGSTFVLRGPDGRSRPGRLRLPGRFNVANALLAVALLDAVGVPVEAALAGLADTVVPGRMEPVDAGQPFAAVVDFAHTPPAVEAALATLRATATGRLIAVLGCGGDRDGGKRPEMGRVAAEGSDVLIVTDDNPRSEDPAAIRAAMLAGARAVAGGARVLEVGDRRAAIAEAVRLARPGDTVLIAGKGHESGQEVAGTTTPFDDRAVLREAIGAAVPAGAESTA